MIDLFTLDSFFTEKYFGYNKMIGHSLQEADLSLRSSSFVSKNYLLIHVNSKNSLMFGIKYHIDIVFFLLFPGHS